MTKSDTNSPDYKAGYFKLLRERYESEEEIASEIINPSSILELPKRTDHFVSDLHGEFQSFQHVLRNGSGNVKVKIEELFKDQPTDKELSELAAVVYYPEEKLSLIRQNLTDKNALNEWYKLKEIGRAHV